MAHARKSVFISYAHEDRDCVDELRTYLAPWISGKRLAVWDDAQIRTGKRWETAIRKAIDEASVAVLMVSKDFLGSEFISKTELPILLDRAEKGLLSLAWIAVGYSGVDVTPLWAYQAVNDPEKPLESLRKAKRSKTMVDIARKISEAATLSTLAGGLHIVDETTEPLEAALQQRPERSHREFGVQARYHPREGQITFEGSTETITAEDLKDLPDEDHEFIADLEDALRRNYARWRDVRKELGTAGGSRDRKTQDKLNRIAKLICRDLNTILDFLRKMHKYALEDHYLRYRFICEQLYGT